MGIGAGGWVSAPGRPEFVTRSAKERLMRPTLAAPTMITAAGPNSGESIRIDTRSLTAKRLFTWRMASPFTGKRRPGT